jgi:hypothetical protein
MPEINLPEVKLPDIKLPDGFREMNRDDLMAAARDVRLPKVELPKRVEMPDIDLSNVNLPKPIADRLPKRRRPNPFVPFAGLLAISAMIAAVWWLFTSPQTGPRMRVALNDLKARVTGQRHDLVRYDDEQDLGSLVGAEERSLAGSSYTSPTTAGGMATPAGSSDFSEVPVGPGRGEGSTTTY